MLALFDEAVRRREILAACGWKPGANPGDEPEQSADTRMLDRVLREFSPLCCFLGDETTEKWTTLALGPLDDYKVAHALLRATGVR